jgi:hypothetical protein
MTAVGTAARDRRRSALRRHRSDLLLALVVALVVLPVLQPLMAQQISRYALTASLVDEGTVSIEPYRDRIGVDRAERDGVLYSDKAPGQPVLAVPAYGLYRLLGGAPGTQAATFADLGLWAVSVLSAGLPAVALAVLMRRFALRWCPERATEAALALALGTMLLPFATVLFSHVLSALCALAAYLLATRRGGGIGAAAAAGAVVGVGVTVEYTLGVLVVVLGVVVLLGGEGVADRARRGAAYALGGLPFALLLGWYHHLAFGGPLEVGYRYGQFAEHDSGIVGVRLPDPATTATVLLGERGLLVLTPIVLVGIVGLVVALRRGIGPRRDTVAALVVVGCFVAIMGGWSNPWAGASPGPRYVTPALPFLAGGVAVAWARWPVAAFAAAFAGTVGMALGTFTLPLAQPTEPSALLHWADRALDGRWADTLLSVRLGDWAIVLPLLAAGAAAVVLLRGEAAARRSASASAPTG